MKIKTNASDSEQDTVLHLVKTSNVQPFCHWHAWEWIQTGKCFNVEHEISLCIHSRVTSYLPLKRHSTTIKDMTFVTLKVVSPQYLFMSSTCPSMWNHFTHPGLTRKGNW